MKLLYIKFTILVDQIYNNNNINLPTRKCLLQLRLLAILQG